MAPEIHLYDEDLPEGLVLGPIVAIDTEAMGLNPHRDRLCLVQLSQGGGVCHLVKIKPGQKSAPRLEALLKDPNILKLFHFARFDVAILQHTFNLRCAPIYCTKIASKLVRTFIDRHGLKDLCRELLGVDISKTQQSSDWGAEVYTPEQKLYAATDVLHLHALKDKLDALLVREGRTELAKACWDFIPYCADIDLLGYEELKVLAH